MNDATGGKLGGIQSKLLAMDKAVQRMHSKLAALGSRSYRVALNLIDRVTQPGSKINNLLRSMASKAYNISMKVNDAALNKIRQIEASLARLAGRAYTVAVNVKDNVTGKLKGITDGALMGMGVMGAGMLGTAGIGYGVANAAQAYMNFEKQMSRVQALKQLDKNSAEMQALVQQAKDLGMQTAWTREQVGQAQEYMALAGWETPQILKATPHMLNLASAGGMELGAASDMMTDAMTAFGLQATDTFKNAAGKFIDMPEYFADMLAKVQASSNTDLYQLKEAIKYGAPTIGTMFAGVEGQEGVQLRTEAARQMMIMAGLMANSGIKGSMAGTGINTIFNRLAGENRNTFFAERLLGLQHAENGNMLMPLDFIKGFQKKIREGMNVDEFTQIAEELAGEKIHADTRRKLNSTIESALKNGGKLGSADVMKMSSMLAGLENMPKLLAMVFQDIDALEAKMNNVEGTAGEMADTMLQNLSGDLTKLGSAWDAFQQGFFEGGAGDGLREFVQSLTQIVSRANELFKDGIQIGDIGNLIADVVDRLKSKFMELDGIGSILAGGALMAGLGKIISMVQRTIGYFRQLKGLQIGQMLGGATGAAGAAGSRGIGGAISGASQVGTMNVTAGVVNIASKVSGGTTGAAGAARGAAGIAGAGGAAKGTAAISPAILAAQQNLAAAQAARDKALAAAWGNPNVRWQQQILRREEANVAQAQKALINARVASYNEQIAQGKQAAALAQGQNMGVGIGSTMRGAAMGGAAFAAIFGAMDFLNAKSMSRERSAAIAADIESARAEYQNLQANNAAPEHLAQMLSKIHSLEADQTAILRENQNQERDALAGATGSVAGAAIGSALGSLIGPMGTMIGGMIGGLVGGQLGTAAAQIETAGQSAGQSAEQEPQGKKFFDYGNEPGSAQKVKAETPPASMGDFRVAEDASRNYYLKYQREQLSGIPSTSDFRKIDEGYYKESNRRKEQEHRFAVQDEKLRSLGLKQYQGTSYDAYGAGQAAVHQFKRSSETTRQKAIEGWTASAEKFSGTIKQSGETAFKALAMAFAPSMLIDKLLGGGRAEAAELNESQLAQQAAMERGESPAAELTTPEVETSNFGESFLESLTTLPESVGEILSSLGEAISEGLNSAFEGAGETLSTFSESITETLSGSLEGVGEVFLGLGESITENLSSAFEGASEVVSSFGEMLSEGLTSTLEGASAMFSSFGEMVSSGLAAAQGAAESALAAIGATFESVRSAIMSAWGELPGFFSGVFSGLGGAAAAAGSAIYSGLTSVIGAVIGAWQSAASTVSSIIASISAAASSVAGMIPSIGGGGGGGAGFAEGGFVNSETHFYAGEHGPEVIIPLSSSKRSRALDLFDKTAAILGGEAAIPASDYTEAMPEISSVGSLPTIEGESGAVTTNQQTSNKTAISLGGMTVTFNITGDSPREIMETIKENLDELSDRIMGSMSGKVADCFKNMALD